MEEETRMKTWSLMTSGSLIRSLMFGLKSKTLLTNLKSDWVVLWHLYKTQFICLEVNFKITPMWMSSTNSSSHLCTSLFLTKSQIWTVSRSTLKADVPHHDQAIVLLLTISIWLFWGVKVPIKIIIQSYLMICGPMIQLRIYGLK